MFQDQRVVVTVPAGRTPYLEILAPYLLRARGVVDEVRFWVNSYIEEDRECVRRLVSLHAPYFTSETHEIEVDRLGWGWSIYPFYKNCTEMNTVYVRVDDDTVWVAPDAVENLVRFRVENPHYFLVYANVVNNPITSHVHQRLGAMHLESGYVHYDAEDPTGYDDAAFWEAVHRQFLARLKTDQLAAYRFERWELTEKEKMPVNFVAWRGEEFAGFGGDVPRDEESFLALEGPERAGKVNCVCGTALVSHAAYWKQRVRLFAAKNVTDEFDTEVFKAYRDLVVQPPETDFDWACENFCVLVN